MGNCQVGTTEEIQIKHPEGKIERIYWPIRACHVMNSNPGHYVSLIITRYKTENNRRKDAVKYLKLLSSEDSLLLRNTYLLVTFEEVLNEFKPKRYVKLSDLLKKRNKICTMDAEAKIGEEIDKIGKLEPEGQEILNNNSNLNLRKSKLQNKNWKPALQSIQEGCSI